MRMNRQLARLLVAAALAAVAACAVPSGAAAATACTERLLSQPFLDWGDEADYFLAPNGGFESYSSGWTLDNGARVGSGNERLGLTEGYKMLRLYSWGTASSVPFCVTDREESFRFAVRNAGSTDSTLDVFADVEWIVEGEPQQMSVHLGTIDGATTSWSPSPIFTYGRFPTSNADISIRFEASSPGSSGDWRIDAVFVDPFRCC